MLHKFVDIVDENNIPNGTLKKQFIVHETGLWHRVVHILLFKKGII